VSTDLLPRRFLAQLIFSTLKMEAIYSFETPVDTQRTTWRYIPEDGALYTATKLHTNILILSSHYAQVGMSHPSRPTGLNEIFRGPLRHTETCSVLTARDS
jgi:hypothetical protein